MKMYLWIALGSAIGGATRYWVSGLVAQKVGETFPWGTLVVNVSGSFLIGLIATLTQTEGRFLVSPELRQFLMVGVLGGYTTFSSFSLQTLNLAREGEWAWSALNIASSVICCLLGVWLGHVTAGLINEMEGP